MNSQALLTLFLILLHILPAEARERALISLYDSAVRVGGQIELKAKVEKDRTFPFRSDLKNIRVRFFIDDAEVGESYSDRDGMARLTLNHALGAGQYKIQAAMGLGRRYRATPGVANLFIWETEQKLIVSDIDQTLSQADKLDVIRLPISEQRSFPHAAEVLSELADQGVGIIYLTAREDALMEQTRQWLSFHGFPAGHLVMWDFALSGRPWNHGDFKAKVLTELTARFPGQIKAGFGDRPHDIVAYLRNQIPAYLLRSESNQSDIFPVGRTDFSSWREIPGILDL